MMQYLLGSRFQAVQKECFNVLATFFSALDQDMFPVVEGLVETVTALGQFHVEEY